MNKDKIKHFQTEFKARANGDKLYDSVYKVFSHEMKLFEPFIKSQSDLEKQNKSLFLERSNKISDDHQVLYDKYVRAYHVIVDKNSKEIENQHQNLLSNIHDINGKHEQILDHIQDERDKLQEHIESQLNQAKLKMNREIFDIEERYKKYRSENLNMIDEVEAESKAIEESLHNHDDKQKRSITNQRYGIVDVKSDAIEITQEKQVQITSKNNTHYIHIKKTFNDTNVAINQKISQLSKSHQQALNKLDNAIEKLNQPILENIKSLKEEYNLKVEEMKQNYAKELESYDLAFEETLAQYKEKREKITHESGEAISIFNSKLTNSRESIEEEKNKVVREHRFLMKDKEDNYDSSIAGKMKSALNKLDKELAKLILQNQNDILKMKSAFQLKLTQAENNFLEKRYQWRLNKLILTNHFHHSLKKLEVNFENNIEFANKKHRLNNDQGVSKREILNHTLNQDALPLETQIAIQNYVQERELTLLNNDQEIALNDIKIEVLNIEHAYELAEQELNYLEVKTALDLESEMLVLNSNTQLELEKAKIKREENLKDYQLRKTLSESVFKRQKNQLDTEYELKNIEWHFQEEVTDIKTHEERFLAKRKETLMYHKRSLFMRDADVKTKSRIQQNEAVKAIRNYENDIEYEQNHIESLVSTLTFSFDRILKVKDMIDKLYHLPAHPDIFKQLLDLFKSYVNELNLMIKEAVNEKQTKIFKYLEKQKSDISHYKHALKHETFQFFNQNNVDQYDIDMKRFEDEIKDLEGFILVEQAVIERHQNFITQLEKILLQYKEGTLLNDSNQVEENKKLIYNHKSHIKTSLRKIKAYEKVITKHHRAMNLIAYKKQRVSRAMRIEDYSFKKRLLKDMRIYDKYEKEFAKIYKNIELHFDVFSHAFDSFEKYINEHIYVTEDQMRQAIAAFMKKANLFADYISIEQQNQLKLAKKYYQVHLDKEALLIQQIKIHQEHASKLLRQSSNIFNRSVEKMLKVQDKLTVEALQHAKKHQKRQTVNATKKFKKDHISMKLLIESQENQIHTLTKQVEQQILTINQNQHEIALQYMNDSLEKGHKEKENHEKKLKAISTHYQRKIDDVNHANDHLFKKNQLILSKFKEKETQTLNQHHIKLKNLKDKVVNAQKKIKQLELDYQKAIKSDLKKRDATFKSLNKDMKQQNKITKKREDKQLINDLKEEKQSYKFKIKTLNLE